MPTGPRRTKSIEFRLLGFVGVLVVLAALAAAFYCLYQHEAGRRKLALIQKELTAEGILRPFAEIVPPASEAEIQSSRDFIAATSGIEDLSKSDVAIQNGPAIMRFASPGCATSGVAEAIPVFESSSPGDAPKSWDAFRLRLAPGAEILHNAKAILQRPLAFPYDYTARPQLDVAGRAQQLTAWLRADATLRLRDGDLPGAIDDLEAIGALASYVGRPHTLICTVLQMGIWSYGLRALSWEALQSSSLSEPDLVRLAHLASSQKFLADADAACQIEDAFQPAFFRQIKESSGAGLEITLFEKPAWLFDHEVGRSFQRALWEIAFADADEAQSTAFWGNSVKEIRHLLIDPNWPRAQAALIVSTPPEERQYPVTKALCEGGTGIIRASVRAETNRQIILTAIALERYRLKNTVYPTALDQLVPDYLPGLPPDLYDGKPLKYGLLPTGQYLLYSVGEDGIDGGGDTSPKGKSANPSFDSGRDLVWPRLQK